MFRKTATLVAIIFALLLCLLMAGAAAGQDSLPPAALQAARACGLDSFAAVAQLRFTFHVVAGDKQFARSWLWDVRNDRVTATTPGSLDTFVYRRADVHMDIDDRAKKTDGQFVNDQYWLLFPLHLAWDHLASCRVVFDERLPLGGGQATRMTVTYPPGIGYTPGDAYDLYLGSDNRVEQWVYRRANADMPTRSAFWKGYSRVGPLTLSLDRPGSDTSFHVWFTDVAVMRRGSSSWVAAQPARTSALSPRKKEWAGEVMLWQTPRY